MRDRPSGSVGVACHRDMRIAYLLITILVALANSYAAIMNFVGVESVKVVADHVQMS